MPGFLVCLSGFFHKKGGPFYGAAFVPIKA